MDDNDSCSIDYLARLMEKLVERFVVGVKEENLLQSLVVLKL